MHRQKQRHSYHCGHFNHGEAALPAHYHNSSLLHNQQPVFYSNKAVTSEQAEISQYTFQLVSLRENAQLSPLTSGKSHIPILDSGQYQGICQPVCK